MFSYLKHLGMFPLCLLLSALCPSYLWAKPIVFAIDPDKTLVEFKVKARFHMVHGISVEKSSGEFQVDPLTQKVRLPIETRMEVETFKTGIFLRDKAMYKMFDAENYPHISGRIDEVDCPELPERGEVICYLRGGLTIRDIEQPMEFAAKLYRDGKVITVEGDFTITTTQFELKPPSLYGLFRVGENVYVHILTTWRRKE